MRTITENQIAPRRYNMKCRDISPEIAGSTNIGEVFLIRAIEFILYEFPDSDFKNEIGLLMAARTEFLIEQEL